MLLAGTWDVVLREQRMQLCPMPFVGWRWGWAQTRGIPWASHS